MAGVEKTVEFSAADVQFFVAIPTPVLRNSLQCADNCNPMASATPAPRTVKRNASEASVASNVSVASSRVTVVGLNGRDFHQEAQVTIHSTDVGSVAEQHEHAIGHGDDELQVFAIGCAGIRKSCVRCRPAMVRYCRFRPAIS